MRFRERRASAPASVPEGLQSTSNNMKRNIPKAFSGFWGDLANNLRSVELHLLCMKEKYRTPAQALSAGAQRRLVPRPYPKSLEAPKACSGQTFL